MRRAALARRELQNRGYPGATVAVRGDGRIARRRSSSRSRADADVPACFGPVTIDGNTSVGTDVIDRVLAVRPDQTFTLAALQQSQRRLYDLDLFRVATVENPSSGPSPEARSAFIVAVVEDKHRRLEMSGGYGTEERLRAALTWKHLNFFGGGRTATVRDQMVFARSRRARVFHAAMLLCAPITRSPSAARNGSRTSRRTARHDRRAGDGHPRMGETRSGGPAACDDGAVGVNRSRRGVVRDRERGARGFDVQETS